MGGDDGKEEVKERVSGPGYNIVIIVMVLVVVGVAAVAVCFGNWYFILVNSPIKQISSCD